MATCPGMLQTETMSYDVAVDRSAPMDLRITGAVALFAASLGCDVEPPPDAGMPCSTATSDGIDGTEGTEVTEGAYIGGPDRVAGNLIMLNENGGWSWFQDERAIYDADADSLLFSSVANHVGHAGDLRDANVEVTSFALATGHRTRVVLGNVQTRGVGDDHNAAALWSRPDGRYLAMYTGHNYHRDGVPESFYRITTRSHEGADWWPEQTFRWPANDVTEPIKNDVTYSNLLYLADEDRLYNIARAADRTLAIMVSDDWGRTWRYGGKLSVTDALDRGYQYSNGYFKFSSNGVDRIDFIATEHHPWDYDTSIYHGYIQGGRSYDGHGNLVDDDLFDEEAPEPAEFTPVWETAGVSSTSYHHGWMVDLERDDDGGIYALFTTRYGTAIATELPGDADHRLFYTRFDGVQWHTTELAKMGPPLYRHQRDYTGLGAIHPNDHSRIYISAPFHPHYGTPTARHEIYAGVTEDGGAHWTWTAITCSSTEDNLRPIVPSWDADHTAVLWLRGRYSEMKNYDLGVVGVIDRSRCESTTPITYVDADEDNTSLADGSPLVFPEGASRTDDRWHQRHGFGNAGSVLASNERDDEDAPRLRTRIEGLTAGTYDVFVFQWADPDEDWRIQAGFPTSELLVFRQKTSQLAEPHHFEDGSAVTLEAPNVRMHRSYVGRVDVTDDGTIEVLVDDVGSGAPERTWYDGLGYARVSPSAECQRPR